MKQFKRKYDSIEMKIYEAFHSTSFLFNYFFCFFFQLFEIQFLSIDEMNKNGIYSLYFWYLFIVNFILFIEKINYATYSI